MSTKRFGFTLIEVALFLALTGVLFVGIAVGTQNTITRQRYNDSVQNFAEFLRGIYSEVSNPQSVSTGRSETTAIYGKLVVFGEGVGLDGKDIPDNEQKIFVYDVVGDVSGSGTGHGNGSVADMLNELNANVVVPVADDGGSVLILKSDGVYKKKAGTVDELEKVNDGYHFEPAGVVESYAPRWQAEIEKTGESGNENGESRWTGSILIVRHPRSGTINTLVAENEVINVNDAVNKYGKPDRLNLNMYELLIGKLDSFETVRVDFCVNPNGFGHTSDSRRDIRIEKNARNASAVEIINLDDSDNSCVN